MPYLKLKALFSGKQTKFSTQAAHIITAFCLKASGASDAAKEAIICGTVKALMYEMGVKLSHEKLARGCPKEGTFVNWERDFATSCQAANTHSIIEKSQHLGKPVTLGLMTDHGNSSGTKFFAKLGIYATKSLPPDDSWSLNFSA